MIQFTRHDPNAPGTHETLTLVRLDGSGDLAIQVETGTPETWRRNDRAFAFAGLFDLTGEKLQIGGETWEMVEAVEFVGDEARMLARVLEMDAELREDEDPSLDAFEVAEALRNAWESGTCVCEAAS